MRHLKMAKLFAIFAILPNGFISHGPAIYTLEKAKEFLESLKETEKKLGCRHYYAIP